MNNSTATPSLGQILRGLLTSTGIRKHIAEIGKDKDLDDAANESRQGSTCDLIEDIEEVVGELLAKDIGPQWADFLGQAWTSTRMGVQKFVSTADVSLLDPANAADEVRRSFTMPLASAFLAHAFKQHGAPDLDTWSRSPFAAWCDLATAQTGVNQAALTTRICNLIDVDPRTIDRWMAGLPSTELCWPFLPIVRSILSDHPSRDKNAADQQSAQVLQNLAAWLMLSVAFQAQTQDLRDAIRLRFQLADQQRWSADHAIDTVNGRAITTSNRPARATAMKVMLEAEDLLVHRPIPADKIDAKLTEFKALFQLENERWQPSYQYIHDWLKGRLAASLGHEEDALALYARAVDAAWWCSGPNQKLILKEALLYAVGTGAKIAAARYWDKIHLLGLNHWPKAELDDQELRRLSMAFEQMLEPQKSKTRVPPPMEVILQEKDFKFSRQAEKSPNAKVKHAEGQTRRTPLMDAVLQGTIHDVEKLVKLGGDPNSFIPESGEGPLTYAMRRAWQSHDMAIMRFLLSLDITCDTVNRAASTMRETPLKLAIEMADHHTVERLIDLGARVEVVCGHLPSALCYAMSVFQTSLQGPGAQSAAYLRGQTPPDVYDAKRGVILDVELSTTRANFAMLLDAHPDNKEIAQTVWKHLMRPANQYRSVVMTLLRRHANANCIYRSSPTAADDWTPTLFAAQIGNVDVLQALVKHGGDVGKTLTKAAGLDRMDALWIAIANGRHDAVRYLSSLPAVS